MPPAKRTVCHCTHVPKKGGGTKKVTIKVPQVKIGTAVKVGKKRATAKKATAKKAPPKKAPAKKASAGQGAKCKCN